MNTIISADNAELRTGRELLTQIAIDLPQPLMPGTFYDAVRDVSRGWRMSGHCHTIEGAICEVVKCEPSRVRELLRVLGADLVHGVRDSDWEQ